MQPIVDGLEETYGDRIVFRRVNADKDNGPAIVRTYHVLGHPTIILVDRNGKELERFVGPQSVETLQDAIEKTLLATNGDAVATPLPLSANSEVPPVPTLNAERVMQGKTIYTQYCAACHGVNGEGQPDWKIPLDDGSLPAPPHDSTGHTWHHADGQLAGIVANGNKLIFPQSKMPAFGEQLSDDEISAVLEYIKTFWGDEERAVQWRITYQTEILPNQTAEEPTQ